MLLLGLCLIICALLAAAILVERKLEHRHFGASYEKCERDLYLDILEEAHTRRIVHSQQKGTW